MGAHAVLRAARDSPGKSIRRIEKGSRRSASRDVDPQREASPFAMREAIDLSCVCHQRAGERFATATGDSAMTDMALPGSIEPAHRPDLNKGFNPLTLILFTGILAGGLLYVAYSIYADVDAAGTKITSYVPFLLLFVALLIALGFEFVNGFHDTANAVATVIYTHSLPADVRGGLVGLLQLPRRAALDRRGGLRHHLAAAGRADPAGRLSSAGFAMVFALLIAAIIWNLGTWWLGPAGVELAHADRLDHRRRRRQRPDARPRRHLRRRLGQGDRDRRGAAALADRRLRARRRCCC